jgi:hypothetical protein
MGIARKIENMLQSLYAYCSHSPKKTQEFVDLVDIVETKGQQVLKNIITYWISMLLPTKRVMSKYYAIVLKMHQDARNLELFCDLEVMMGLSCIMPMLERLNDLINFSKS